MKQSQNLETQVREAKPEDFPRIKEISKKAFLGNVQNEIDLQMGQYFENPEKYDTWKRKGVFEKKVLLSQKFYVTEDSTGKILGYAGIERPNIDGDAMRAFWLNWIAVDPEYQGKGIGTGILKELIKQAKKIGATTLSVKTDYSPWFENAHKTYEKLGFKQMGRIPKYYGKNIDLVLYSLDLEDTDLRTKNYRK